jgi:hypothetical protein
MVVFSTEYLSSVPGNQPVAKPFARHVLDRSAFRGFGPALHMCHRTRSLSLQNEENRSLQRFTKVNSCVHAFKGDRYVLKRTIWENDRRPNVIPQTTILKNAPTLTRYDGHCLKTERLSRKTRRDVGDIFVFNRKIVVPFQSPVQKSIYATIPCVGS